MAISIGVIFVAFEQGAVAVRKLGTVGLLKKPSISDKILYMK